jgi:Bifunctional DNA primase/polymerase, N-terminal
VRAGLRYLRRGWAVLPIHQKRFQPGGPVYTSVWRADMMKQWACAESLAMLCGELSRTDVLEIDDAEAFAAAGFDLDALIASTLAAATPSGGRHFFFEFARLPKCAFPWGEWKTTGHVVELPPTPGCRWLNDLAPQPAPPELIELIKQWRTVTFVGARTTRKAKEEGK